MASRGACSTRTASSSRWTTNPTRTGGCACGCGCWRRWCPKASSDSRRSTCRLGCKNTFASYSDPSASSERGRAGYAQYRHGFAKLIWQIASPKWRFDDATFERSAASLDNPDDVDITIHNYRWRLGLAEGEARYDELERRLAAGPVIGVPTITLEGDANGAPHAEPGAYAMKFTGRYAHRVVTGGVGHNLPQEAPRAFAQAVIDVDG
jgi:pimeloyl-ACP methyl ester carboxylesterase